MPIRQKNRGVCGREFYWLLTFFYCVLMPSPVMHRDKWNSADYQRQGKQKREENLTEDEKCVQSPAGPLRCCHCALTRLYVLHRSQRAEKNAEKAEKKPALRKEKAAAKI